MVRAGDWVPDEASRYYFRAGDRLSGDTGTDLVRLENAGSVSFFNGAITSIETLSYAAGVSNVTILQDTFLNSGLQFIIGGPGNDGLMFFDAGAHDYSGLTFSGWTSGQDTISFVTRLNDNDFGPIVGTDLDDFFRVRGYHGALDGAFGSDAAALEALSSAQATWIHNSDSSWTVSGPGQTFTIRDIERLQFTDRTITLAGVRPNDLNGDGTSDILWRNLDGHTVIGPLVNGHVQLGVDLGIIASSWHVAGVTDFTGDGTSDILWRNVDGHTVVGPIVNGQPQPGTDLGIIAPSWQVAGTADFTGDGTSDILWRNADGHTVVGPLVNGQAQAGTDLGIIAPSWQVAGTGDFTSDGTSDILWRNVDGHTVIGPIVGGQARPGTDLGIIAPTWQVAGVGDFTGDGTSDILWRNVDGHTVVGPILNGVPQAGVDLGIIAPSWHAAETADFDGDGTTDILWRNDDGHTITYQMNNGHPQPAGIDLGTIAPSWHVAGGHDLI